MASEHVTTSATTRDTQTVSQPKVVYIPSSAPSQASVRYVVTSHRPTPRTQ